MAQKKEKSDKGRDANIYFVSRIFDLLESAIRYGSIPFFSWLAIRELAGQETVVNFVVDYFSRGGNSLPWALAIAAFLWAYGERKLRQMKTARMSKHLFELESRLDPNRTSSGLTPTGQTPTGRNK